MTTENPYAAPAAKVNDSVPDVSSEIFNNNHLRLMKCHIAVLIFNALIGLGILSLAGGGEKLFLLIIPGIPILLHSILAYGSYKKIEMSRKASVVVFVLLAIGAIPIGTIISIFFFLPATQWKTPPDAKITR
jgi:hypothetical protein